MQATRSLTLPAWTTAHSSPWLQPTRSQPLINQTKFLMTQRNPLLLLSTKEQILLVLSPLPTHARSPARLPAPAPSPALSGLGDPGFHPRKHRARSGRHSGHLAPPARGLRETPRFQGQRALEGRWCDTLSQTASG